MPSPFPGMDPYIEASGSWLDFHGAFIATCREMLNARLPEHYVASMDERTHLVEVTEQEVRLIRPDIAVSRDRSSEAATQRPANGGVATLEPQEIPLALYEEVVERRIEIRTDPDRELVTVIELLSPTNKSHEGFAEYMSKRRAVLRQQVHLLEIDLLLAGKRPSLAGELPPGDYFAFLSRADHRPLCQVYAWNLRHALPTLPVPLKPTDHDVPLDLAELFTLTYDRGRYRQLLRYNRPLDVPLSDTDRRWAEQLAVAE